MDTVAIKIIHHLEGKGFLWAGVLGDEMRSEYGHKQETTSRICRMLVKKGILDAQYQTYEEGKRPAVMYKVRPIQQSLI